MKTCSRCKKRLPKKQFNFTKPGYLRGDCRKCQAVYGKEYKRTHQHIIKAWAARNRAKRNEWRRNWRKTEKGKIATERERMRVSKALRKAYKLKAYYGITPADFKEFIRTQGNKCRICGKAGKENGKHKTLYVDHCHQYHYVRGLLCQNCNTLLGVAKDNIKVLEAAAAYLRRYGFRGCRH